MSTNTTTAAITTDTTCRLELLLINILMVIIIINNPKIATTTIIPKVYYWSNLILVQTGQASHLVKCSASMSILEAIINHATARIMHTIPILMSESRLNELLWLRLVLDSSWLNASHTRTIGLFGWGSPRGIVLKSLRVCHFTTI